VRAIGSHTRSGLAGREGNLGTVLRSDPREPVGAFASANATTNANHHKRVMGEAILLVHAELFAVCSGLSRRIEAVNVDISPFEACLETPVDYSGSFGCEPYNETE
jgi:hypothetical protein